MNWIEQKLLGLFVKTNGLLSKPLLGGIAHIFMLHRVLPEAKRNEFILNKDLAISTSFLELTIQDLKQKGYQFISLDELYQILQSGKKPARPCICITLDDGYRDNVTYALPIFQKHQVPFTVYVTNCFPNQEANLWWFWLENILIKSETITFQEEVMIIETQAQKQLVFDKIRGEIKNMTLDQINNISKSFFSKDKKDIVQETLDIALTWDELALLKKERLATIGAHTMNHLSLANQSFEDMVYQISQSKIELEEKLSIKIKHLCYPYGGLEDAGKREYAITKKLGFHTATLNHPGNVFLQHKNNSWTLPRYALGDFVSQERLSHSLNGIRHFAVNGWERVIK